MRVLEFDVLEEDPRLQVLLDFAGRHGRPRAATASAYRALVELDAVAARAFLALDADGEPVAAVLATVSPAIGLDQVQLNAFLAPQAPEAFRAALDGVDEWARQRDATHVTAHVSDPSQEDLEAFRLAGFEQVGERSRVVRTLTTGDARLDAPPVPGTSVHVLADRPELEPAAEALWRSGHEDVPSALRFDSADLPPLRSELGLTEEEPVPRTVLVAVDEGDEVVGLVVGILGAGDQPELRHRMTATARHARGRGIARMLKIELLRRAAAAGIARAVASNDSGNAPMRAINDALGYELEYRLTLLRRPVGSR